MQQIYKEKDHKKIFIQIPLNFQKDSQKHFCDYSQSLFNKFCLLSWLVPQYKCIILSKYPTIDKKAIVYHGTIQVFQQSSICLKQILLFQTCKYPKYLKFPIKNHLEQYRIDYVVHCEHIFQQITKPNLKSQKYSLNYYLANKKDQIYNISVKFKFSYKKCKIRIDIQDQKQFFKNNLKNWSAKRKKMQLLIQQNSMEYYYMEPQNVRHKVFQEKHLSLAFQGGGAKGLAYVGVIEAAQQLKNLNISAKSVIGSSAGGMFALAISSKATKDEVWNIINMIGQIPKRDKIIKTIYKKQKSKGDIELQQRKNIFSQRQHINYNNQKQIDQPQIKELQQKKKEYLYIIKKYLKNNKIMQQNIFQFFFQSKQSDKWIDSILNDIIGDKSGIKQLFLDDNTKLLSNYLGLFEAALMSGNTICKIAIEILSNFILKYVQQKYHGKLQKLVYDEELNFKIENIKQLNYDSIAQKLTMKQYYKMSGVEFTCTAVDLNSQILRFFNHKTTPDLPVCLAVQMTGSFPVVFKSLKWKQQWGKYYIHFSTKRRQLDLTGHQFTDGGMLSNFPIKYLDNNHIRPKYFSHKNTKQTQILGYGLNKINKQNQQQKKEKKIKKQLSIFQKLKKYFQTLIGLGKRSFFNLIKQSLIYLPIPFNFLGTRNQNKVSPINLQKENIYKIPLIKFLNKLLATYKNAEDNLQLECFNKEIFLFQKSFIFGQLRSQFDEKNIIQKSKDFVKKLSKFIQQVNDLSGQYFGEELIQKITQLKQKKLDYDKRLGQLQQYLKFMLKIVNQSQNLPLNDQLYIVNQLNQVRQKTKQRLQVKYFFCGQIYEQFQQQNFIQQVCEKLIALINYRKAKIRLPLDENNLNTLNKIIIKQINMHKQIQKQVLFQFKQVLNHLNFIEYSKAKKQMFQTCKKIGYKFYKNRIFPIFQQFIQQNITNNKMPDIQQQLGFWQLNDKIRQYVQFNCQTKYKKQKTLQMIKFIKVISNSQKKFQITQYNKKGQKKQKKIHLVLQGNNIVNNKYFLAYKVLKEYVYEMQLFYLQQIQDLEKNVKKQNQFQQQNYNIKLGAITTSSGSAFLSLLICLGLDTDQIQFQIKDIFSLYTFYEDFMDKIKADKWVNIQEIQVRNFLDILWDQKFDMFCHLQQYQQQHPNATIQNWQKQLNYCKKEVKQNKEALVSGFEDLIKYIIQTNKQLGRMKRQQNQNQKKQDFKYFLGKRLNFSAYRRQNQKNQKKIRYGVNLLINQFQQSICQLIFNSQQSKYFLNIRELIKNKSQDFKKNVWKQLLISRFLNVYNFKKKVQKILKQNRLPQNLTLKQMDDVSQQKILFTVQAIDHKKNKIIFINKNTYPYMPVWAAVMISVTRPIFSTPIKVQTQWQRQVDCDKKQRLIKNYFQYDQQQQIPSTFTSSEIKSTIGLQYLTNNKIVQKYFDQNVSYLYITFGNKDKKDFQKQKEKQTNKQQPFLLKLLDEYKKVNCINILSLIQLIGSFTNILSVDKIKQNVNIFDIYINSNDNLVHQIYYKSLIRLPISLGTLSFEQLNLNFPEQLKKQKTDRINDIIQQCKYYVLQRVQYDHAVQLKKSSRFTYVKIYKTELNQIRLKFISKQSNCKDYDHWYNIRYRIPDQNSLNSPNFGNSDQDFLQNFKLISKNKIYINLQNNSNLIKIQLLFEYVGQFFIEKSLIVLQIKFLCSKQDLKPFSQVYKIKYNQKYFHSIKQNQQNQSFHEKNIKKIKKNILTKEITNKNFQNSYINVSAVKKGLIQKNYTINLFKGLDKIQKLPKCIKCGFKIKDNTQEDSQNQINKSLKSQIISLCGSGFCNSYNITRRFVCQNINCQQYYCYKCLKIYFVRFIQINNQNILYCHKGHRFLDKVYLPRRILKKQSKIQKQSQLRNFQNIIGCCVICCQISDLTFKDTICKICICSQCIIRFLKISN